ncbi:hypothetical protein [Streptomyces sp. NPDC047990]|uniref:hypothetical protein n=1 Tax=Streptomyces sp. NPDC047990 TaxID=3365496 RepID=UPI00371C816E
MSAMKAFLMDRTELETAAIEAALIPDLDERFQAITKVFEECGERANAYHDPHGTARALVSGVSATYSNIRKARKVITIHGVFAAGQ